MKDFDPLIWMSYFYQAERSCLAQQQRIERHSCEKNMFFIGWVETESAARESHSP